MTHTKTYMHFSKDDLVFIKKLWLITIRKYLTISLTKANYKVWFSHHTLRSKEEVCLLPCQSKGNVIMYNNTNSLSVSLQGDWIPPLCRVGAGLSSVSRPKVNNMKTTLLFQISHCHIWKVTVWSVCMCFSELDCMIVFNWVCSTILFTCLDGSWSVTLYNQKCVDFFWFFLPWAADVGFGLGTSRKYIGAFSSHRPFG